MSEKYSEKPFVKRAVLAAHCVVIGGAFLIQGCGTTRGPVKLPNKTIMPPPATVERPVKVKSHPEIKPVPPPVVKFVPPATPPAKKWDIDAITPYVVGKNETLSGIAHRYGLNVADIVELNSLKSPNKIYVGQKLVLPGKIDTKKSVKKVTHSSKKIPAGASVYEVKPGDCLSVVASRAGTTTKALRAANSLKSNTIYVGQKLVIPAGHKVLSTSGAGTRPTTGSKPHPKPHSAPVNPDRKPPVVAPVPGGGEDFQLPDLDPEVPEATPTTGQVQYYTVKDNDNILSVVSEFNISIAALREANNLTSDILKPGQRLIIPASE